MEYYYKWLVDGEFDPAYLVTRGPKRCYLAGQGHWASDWRYVIQTFDQLPYWCGNMLVKVETKGTFEDPDCWGICTSWRIVEELPWTQDDMYDFCVACATRADQLVNTPLEPGEQISQMCLKHAKTHKNLLLAINAMIMSNELTKRP